MIVKYKSFLHQDQLKKQKELKDNFLKNYEEGTIDFPPTYKLSTFFSMQALRTNSTAKEEFLAGLTVSSIGLVLHCKDLATVANTRQEAVIIDLFWLNSKKSYQGLFSICPKTVKEGPVNSSE